MLRNYNDNDDDPNVVKKYGYYLNKAKNELTRGDGIATDDEIQDLAASYALGMKCDHTIFSYIFHEAKLNLSFDMKPKTTAQIIKHARDNIFYYLENYKNMCAEPDKTIDDSFDANLRGLKNNIAEILKKYICWWKLSFFGHHYDQRACDIKDVIKYTNDPQEIINILMNEKYLIEAGKLVQNNSFAYKLLDEKEFPKLKNEAKYKKSGYYQAIVAALEVAQEKEQKLQLKMGSRSS